LDGETSALSARSSFINPSTLLFFATDLDVTVTHQLTIVNDDGNILAVQAGGLSVMGVQNMWVSTKWKSLGISVISAEAIDLRLLFECVELELFC
jgi:hypothetical protein